MSAAKKAASNVVSCEGCSAFGKPFLTPQQVAAVLAISDDAVIDLIYTRQLPAVLVSKSIRSRKPRYRVSPEALQLFINARMVQAPPPRQARRPAYERHV